MSSQSRLSEDRDSAQPGDIGDLLRASRLRQGEEIADVARSLRIRSVYLQAIEDGRYDDLPGTVYAIGFIRSYAEHLGLDGEQIVNRFKAEVSGTGRKTKLVFPVAIPEHGVPRGAVVTLGIVILTVAYGGWYVLSARDLYVTDLIPPVPESIMRAFDATRSGVASASAPSMSHPRSEPTSAVAATAPDMPPAPPKIEIVPVETASLMPPTAAQPEPEAVAAASPAPAPTPTSTPAQPAPAVSTSAPSAMAAVPAPVSEPRAAEAEPAVAQDEDEADSTPAPTANEPNDPVSAANVILDDRGGADAPAPGSQLASLPAIYDPAREIVLHAIVDCWIEIRDTVGNQKIASRLLRKGDKYTVPSRDGLTLVAGNAGGLDILVGGTPVPSLGPLGVVRRNVVLDPQRLKAGTAVVE